MSSGVEKAKDIIKEELIASYFTVLMEQFVKANAQNWARVIASKIKDAKDVEDKSGVKMTLDIVIPKLGVDFLEKIIYETDDLTKLGKDIEKAKKHLKWR